jgi:hypothetical protein
MILRLRLVTSTKSFGRSDWRWGLRVAPVMDFQAMTTWRSRRFTGEAVELEDCVSGGMRRGCGGETCRCEMGEVERKDTVGMLVLGIGLQVVDCVDVRGLVGSR